MKFLYENHRGEREERDVVPLQLIWAKQPGFGYPPGLFLFAFDKERNANRTFSLNPANFSVSELPDTQWDDDGSTILFAFPSPEQINLANIHEAVISLTERLEAATSKPNVQYFYRHLTDKAGPVTGPVATLPDMVRINRDVFQVWATELLL